MLSANKLSYVLVIWGGGKKISSAAIMLAYNQLLLLFGHCQLSGDGGSHVQSADNNCHNTVNKQQCLCMFLYS